MHGFSGRALTLPALFIGCLTCPPPVARAQDPVVDQGVLIIMRGPAVLAQEEFVLRRGRSSTPGGFTLTTSAYYAADARARILTATVELGPDSQPSAAQFDSQNGDERRVLVRFGRRRVTVRILTLGGESAREYPGADWHVVIDDSLFAHHAVAPVAGLSGTGAAIWSHGGRREPARVTDHGIEPTWIDGEERALRHWSVAAGGTTRHLWYDSNGRLIKGTVPDENLTVLRAAPRDR